MREGEKIWKLDECKLKIEVCLKSGKFGILGGSRNRGVVGGVGFEGRREHKEVG